MTDPHANGIVRHAGAPLERASVAAVLLHGRGSTAEDILGLAPAFDLPEVAFVAPQATGHSWYPLSFLAPRAANEPYLCSALARVRALVQSLEQGGMDRMRIVIAGFSQGACLATEFVAGDAYACGGLIAFTGGLIGPEGSTRSAETCSGEELRGMPAFLGSGDPDSHVPWTRVEASAEVLRAMGANVTTQCYPGRPHTVTADEISRAREVLLAAQRSPKSS